MLLLLCVASGRAFGQSPPPADRPPEVWAIVVGVDDYTNPAIPDGRTSVRNAQQVRRRDPAGRLGRPAPGPPQRRRRRRARRADGLRGQHQHPAEPAESELGIPAMAPQEGTALATWWSSISPGRSRCVADSPGGPARRAALPPAEGCRSGEARADRLVLEEAVDECVRNKLRVVCWLATAPGDPPAPGPATCPLRRRADAGPGAGWSAGVAWLSRLARWPGVTAWLASDRPRPAAAGKVADPGDVFTRRCCRPSAHPVPLPTKRIAGRTWRPA